ncbi:MAG: hypothetical protein ABI723_01250 [Bacteroidia bacterium]
MLFISIEGFGQSVTNSINLKEDSIIINRISENFVEVKSLRQVLSKGYALPKDSLQIAQDKANNLLDGGYVFENYIPRGPHLKNGIVVIKDKDNSILKIKYYSDSIQVLTEEYNNNILIDQTSFSPCDSTVIEKYYFNDGRLQRIDLFDPKKQKERIIVDYSEKGEIINAEIK